MNDRMLSNAVEDLTGDGTEPQALCPDEIVIPRDVVQFGNLIGKLRLRCEESGVWQSMGYRIRLLHDRWRAGLMQPEALAALQHGLRSLCIDIRTAEAPRLIGLSWTAYGPRCGLPPLTIASTLQPPVDRKARRDAIANMAA
ncbi:hypothetical protein [Mitsuaria sp. 7]|uniref:hypothetical protein n=1 Tax=Mitsuaria sp. 7 TaxID=1658665 RepID=UPI0012F7E534|nr:hypothetical protein [Mitsuaria sp. 7]